MLQDRKLLNRDKIDDGGTGLISQPCIKIYI